MCVRLCVFSTLSYPGTHDNDTTNGWFEKQVAEGQRSSAFIKEYVLSTLTPRSPFSLSLIFDE